MISSDSGMLPFLELDSTIVKDMITVNITSATYLCHQVSIHDENTKVRRKKHVKSSVRLTEKGGHPFVQSDQKFPFLYLPY